MNAMILHQHALAAASGMGGLGEDKWWEPLVAGGFDFGKRFLSAYEARGVARTGQNPYYNPYVTATATPTGSTLTPAEIEAIARRAASGDDPAGPGVTGKGLSKAWGELAQMFGVESSTLTLMTAGAFVLLYMTPPRKK